MARSEGARRIMTVGKVVTVFGLTIAVVCALLILARPEFFLGSLLALICQDSGSPYGSWVGLFRDFLRIGLGGA